MVLMTYKTPAEGRKQVFDFISELAPSETITAAACTSRVWSGVDSTPQAMISGGAVISGTQATQLIAGGVAGVTYKITCTIQTSAGQTLVQIGYLPVLENPV